MTTLSDSFQQLTAEQAGYAGQVVAAVEAAGGTKKDAVIATETALAESEFRLYANSNVPSSLNYPHTAVGHDHNSLGIFQQQTPGWGTVADLMNPTYDTTRFIQALFTKSDREAVPNWVAAQEVQNSGYADGSNYRVKDQEAQQLVDQLWGKGDDTLVSVVPVGTVQGSGTPSTDPKAPFGPGTLTAPLTNAQAAGVAAYLTTVSSFAYTFSGPPSARVWIGTPEPGAGTSDVRHETETQVISDYYAVQGGYSTGAGQTTGGGFSLSAPFSSTKDLIEAIGGTVFNTTWWKLVGIGALGVLAVIIGAYLLLRSDGDAPKLSTVGEAALL